MKIEIESLLNGVALVGEQALMAMDMTEALKFRGSPKERKGIFSRMLEKLPISIHRATRLTLSVDQAQRLLTMLSES